MKKARTVSFFTGDDFKTVFSPPMGDDDLDFIADRANAKRDVEIEKLRAENERLRDENEMLNGKNSHAPCAHAHSRHARRNRAAAGEE